MPWMWRDPLEEAEGWREAEAHWSRCREMWEGVSETGDDALMAAESWRGRGPGSDSPHPHGASWLTSLSVRCGISLLQLLYEQQPHLSLSHHHREAVHLCICSESIYLCSVRYIFIYNGVTVVVVVAEKSPILLSQQKSNVYFKYA